MSAHDFSHLDEHGGAQMVDVSAKSVTRRVACASCRLELSPSTIERLQQLPKGDATVVAKIAGVLAAKKTGELIPLAHPLPLEQIEVELEPTLSGGAGKKGVVVVRTRVVVTAKTGAEMEALTACAMAALALYDMVKAVEREAVITNLRLESKSGGRSGDYRRDAASVPLQRTPNDPTRH